MNITKNQLKQIIKEELNAVMESYSDEYKNYLLRPEDPEVMADIERRNNMGLEEKVKEWYDHEISDLAMIIFHEGLEEDQMEQGFAILGEDPRYVLETIKPEELPIIWKLALEDAENM